MKQTSHMYVRVGLLCLDSVDVHVPLYLPVSTQHVVVCNCVKCKERYNSVSQNNLTQPFFYSKLFIFLSIDLGGAFGTAKAGSGLMAMGIRSPELLMKNIIPVVMAGVLGIYGLM